MGWGHAMTSRWACPHSMQLPHTAFFLLPPRIVCDFDTSVPWFKSLPLLTMSFLRSRPAHQSAYMSGSLCSHLWISWRVFLKATGPPSLEHCPYQRPCAYWTQLTRPSICVS